jgi:hypothetical protein
MDDFFVNGMDDFFVNRKIDTMCIYLLFVVSSCSN